MAQFRAIIRGQRGEASRLGSKTSGIRTETNGWTGGVVVRAQHYGEGHPASDARTEGREHDCFEIYATTGSGRGPDDGYIGLVIDGRFTPSDKLRQRIIREYLAAADADEPVTRHVAERERIRSTLAPRCTHVARARFPRVTQCVRTAGHDGWHTDGSTQWDAAGLAQV